MKIDILAFGIAKDIIKSKTLSVDVPAGATVGSLKSQLCEQYPGFQELRSLAIAVNEAYRKDEFELNEKDEVVLIPPVSGG